jgi:hypothetical protein
MLTVLHNSELIYWVRVISYELNGHVTLCLYMSKDLSAIYRDTCWWVDGVQLFQEIRNWQGAAQAAVRFTSKHADDDNR